MVVRSFFNQGWVHAKAGKSVKDTKYTGFALEEFRDGFEAFSRMLTNLSPEKRDNFTKPYEQGRVPVCTN